MSKVKITQEQAKIIEETKFALAGFSNKMLVRCLNGEYEIEPSFKVGDWVIDYEESCIGKVTDIDDDCVWSTWNGDKFTTKIYRDQLRHATPEEIAEEKERRWWAKRGREPWELKVYDLLMNRGGTVFEVENATGNKVELWTIQKPIGKSFALNHIQRNFKVICFAENRLDVKDDE